MMKKKRFYEKDLKSITVYSHYSSIKVVEVTKLFETFSVRADSELIYKIPGNMLDEERLKVFTGLSWNQFEQIRNMITIMRNSSTREVCVKLCWYFY